MVLQKVRKCQEEIEASLVVEPRELKYSWKESKGRQYVVGMESQKSDQGCISEGAPSGTILDTRILEMLEPRNEHQKSSRCVMGTSLRLR